MMIKPENWNDTVFVDAAVPRTTQEEIERLLYVWRSMTDITSTTEDRPGHWTTAAIPAKIRSFLSTNGVGDAAFANHYLSEAISALMSMIAAYGEDGPQAAHEILEDLIEAMAEDAAEGYVVFRSDQGDVLYISEELARKEGHIE